ncbi:Rne/Rng family ribonuclease [Geomonas nitrogeniifigens]|uniref:Ribonuclease G n=1 Tax=Geomonas diazotrophica TaxID=2843197 RepID=A0ABX8JJJ5_9BACT|nr:Rne/Rng family ribonuclease [Geomonas nitrogeniifigens]QWV98151.1 Rne/Rng family ribonuclease [Geomonas nitrogeniifigens]QXE87282.1 Rne/Rng family ribonuclease [Geomonas nitrogeniifigens]
MSKKMLINALHAEEARVAIVEDGRLVDLDVEIAGNEQTRGNIYKGVVVRVEPGLQAAFVDIGLKKLGFLQMGELHPENWKWRDDIPEEQRHRRPRIQEVLRRGQELIVQVEKGERDNKGSALTTYISLPGRYMVLMPGSDSAGISRKVEAEGERKKLKEIIAEMTIPQGYGYIIRTEAMGRTRDELQKDLDSLIALYEGIRERGAGMKGAGMAYQESALIIRTIRDYFSSDIDEVLVDSKDVFKDVRDALKEIDPDFEKLVKMHQEKRPIFSRYQLEEQIDLIYEKKVPLKSGGSIFIEPTEALVSIDVNSGKSTGEKGVEDTAFKTNLEAAEEAARQLRLRDLGGLIVIDFIDMRDRKHNAEVEKTLKNALKADKARVNVARISEFGLLEMSRQRIRQTLNQASTLECPHCDGRGKVKSVEAMALSFLRKVHAAAAKGTIGEVVGSLPLEVAYYLLNRKRHELSQIENDYDIEVTVKGKPSYLLNQMELELIKREKLPQEDLPQEKPFQGKAPAKEEQLAAEPAEGRKKKKRGKKAQEPEAAQHAEAVPIAVIEEPSGAEHVVTLESEPEEHKKKRRRKRKRGKGGAAEGGAEHAATSGEAMVELAGGVPAELTEPGAVLEQPAAQDAEQAHAEPGEEVKKKRRRKRRRGKGGHEAAGEQTPGEAPHAASEVPAAAVSAEAVPAAEGAAPGGEPGEKKPARKRRGRGKGAAADGAPEAAVASVAAMSAPAEAPAEQRSQASAPAPVEAAKPEKKARTPRKTKAVTETGATPAAPAAAADAPQEKPAQAKKGRGAKGAATKAPASAPAPAVTETPAPKPKAAKAAKKPKEATETAAPKEAKAPKQAKEPKAAKAAKEPAEPGKAKAAKGPKQGKAPNGSGTAAPAAETKPAEAVPAKEKAPAKRARKAAEPAAASEEKPKKPRAPRKKKEETPA